MALFPTGPPAAPAGRVDAHQVARLPDVVVGEGPYVLLLRSAGVHDHPGGAAAHAAGHAPGGKDVVLYPQSEMLVLLMYGRVTLDSAAAGLVRIKVMAS